MFYMVPAGKEQQFLSKLVPKNAQQTSPLTSTEERNQIGGVLTVPLALTVDNIFRRYDARNGGHMRGTEKAKHYVKAKHEAVQLECWLTETFGKNPLRLVADKVRAPVIS